MRLRARLRPRRTSDRNPPSAIRKPASVTCAMAVPRVVCPVGSRVWGLTRQANPRELPAGFRREEVAIGPAEVRPRRGTGPAPQDNLVTHELAVVLAECAGCGGEAGVGDVRARRPLPDVTVELYQTVRGTRHRPRRQQ